ncbi:hypothetical protein FRB99_002580 [Tulasnella sp. 403]|nr:hypothetical protein FRB99_002580 [Tulasnella sp. 403]
MTILFQARKFTDDFERLDLPRQFRDQLLRLFANTLDKRHIVYDYAVSAENTVFIPLQRGWATPGDPSGHVTLKLYTPDFTDDGQHTGYAILQSIWHLYPDGRLMAMEMPTPSARRPGLIKNKLPLAKMRRTSYGFVVGEADDSAHLVPRPLSRSFSETWPRRPPSRQQLAEWQPLPHGYYRTSPVQDDMAYRRGATMPIARSATVSHRPRQSRSRDQVWSEPLPATAISSYPEPQRIPPYPLNANGTLKKRPAVLRKSRSVEMNRVTGTFSVTTSTYTQGRRPSRKLKRRQSSRALGQSNQDAYTRRTYSEAGTSSRLRETLARCVIC